jgi:hypothetical protein
MSERTYVKYLLSALLGMLILVSCEKENNMDSDEKQESEEELNLDIVYINSQIDFDTYKKLKFPAGARIYFAQGKTFNGQFAPTGSGTADNPIILTAYNASTGEIYDENIDSKPIINGQGKVNSSFYLYNGENWEINNLEITNTDGSDADQGNLRGIHVEAEDIGIVDNVTIKNCYVHDVNGKVEGKLRGGIHVHVIGDETSTKFNNLLIENNHIQNIGGVGIGNQSSWGSINDSDYYPWTNYIVRGNRVELTGRNGIIIRASINPIAEYNILANNSRYSTGHNIFNFNTKGCIMQYNESYGNTGEINDNDRGGFDADYNAENTTIQYNYSHDNHWFLGIMRKYNKGITVRYNISINERLGAYEYGFPSDTGVEDVLIYNNTHYFGAGINASPIASPEQQRVPINTSFYNNIFYFEESVDWAVLPNGSCDLSNNLFFNVAPKGKNTITSNPLFMNAGAVSTDIDMHDPDRLAGYRINSNSPCIDAGIVINDNGGKDFWGNAVGTETINIGAYEKQ